MHEPFNEEFGLYPSRWMAHTNGPRRRLLSFYLIFFLGKIRKDGTKFPAALIQAKKVIREPLSAAVRSPT